MKKQKRYTLNHGTIVLDLGSTSVLLLDAVDNDCYSSRRCFSLVGIKSEILYQKTQGEYRPFHHYEVK